MKLRHFLSLAAFALAPLANSQIVTLEIQSTEASWYEEHQASCLDGTCAPRHFTDGNLSRPSSLRMEK